MGVRSCIVALALLSPVAACSADSTYACQDDSSCSLGGEPGICTEVGQCAYPSDECPSGWEYPMGTPGGLAETCAEGPSATSSGASASDSNSDSDSGSTTGSSGSESATSMSSTDSGATSSAVSESASASTTAATMTDGDSSASTGNGSSTGSSIVCNEPDEPDTREQAQMVPVQGCSPQISGYDHGIGDVDWYTASASASCDNGTWRVDPPADAQMVCVVASVCSSNDVFCGNSIQMSFEDGFPACCTMAPQPNNFLLNFDGPCDPPDDFYVLVQGGATGTCTPYDFELDFTDD